MLPGTLGWEGSGLGRANRNLLIAERKGILGTGKKLYKGQEVWKEELSGAGVRDWVVWPLIYPGCNKVTVTTVASLVFLSVLPGMGLWVPMACSQCWRFSWRSWGLWVWAQEGGRQLLFYLCLGLGFSYTIYMNFFVLWQGRGGSLKKFRS